MNDLSQDELLRYSRHLVMPGVLAVEGPPVVDGAEGEARVVDLCREWQERGVFASPTTDMPLVVICDDAELCARNFRNFLWVTFTRSNPSHDVHGVGAFTDHKHWGCRGALVIDARIKPHHAPPLEEDPEVSRRVDALAALGGPLHGII